MTPNPQPGVPPVVSGVAIVIGVLALWALSFSHSCRSDGCIGLFFPVAGAAIALAVQLLVVLPRYGFQSGQSSRPAMRGVLLWGGVSLAAFFVPMAFVKW